MISIEIMLLMSFIVQSGIIYVLYRYFNDIIEGMNDNLLNMLQFQQDNSNRIERELNKTRNQPKKKNENNTTTETTSN